MEPVVEEVRDITVRKVTRWCCSTIMVFGGVVPYIPQYREIYIKQDAEGFSMYVCLALLVANTLRILFWFGKRYELPLLFQSIVMNIMMLLMIHLCVKVRNKTQLIRGPDRYFTDFDWHYFWQWTDFQSYIDFLIAMSICLSIITFIFLHNVIFIEIIGFLALLTEAMLGVPQLVKNLRNRSTEGMSMLKSLILLRGIHISSTNWSSTKAQLLKLRKKTGYPFESCKKALQLNDNSLEKSEAWLKEEAQRLGWAKANKLANRATAQGVIAFAIDSQKEVATMVEVNCETDFVARNKCFHSVVEVVTSSCLDFAKQQKALENSFSKVNLKSGDLMELSGAEGKSLADHVAVTIGNLGENVTLRRATCLNTRDTGLNIMGLTHPANITGTHFLSGKYGSLLIYRKQLNGEKINQRSMESSHDEILRQMCQHVIGMNPKSVGVLNIHEPIKSQEVVAPKTLNENDDSSMDSIDEKSSESTIEEDGMLEQAFLLDPSITVGQVATDYGIDILDFVRYECGES